MKGYLVMIRVGVGKPKLKFIEAHNDMSHYFPSRWETNDYFLMSLNDYMEKKEFDSFDMNGISKVEADKVAKMMENPSDIKFEFNMIEHPYSYRMQQLIKKSGGMLWQFNAVHPNMEDWVRQVVVLGENKLQRWSWYDAHVKLPYLKKLARVLNYMNRYKAQKEIDEWEEFLKNMHKEKKNG